MSIFDADEFLNATTTEAGQRRPPLSPDVEYIGTIGEPKKPHQHPGKDDPTKVYTFMDYPISIDLTSNPVERDRVGQDTVVLNHSVGIDLTDSNALDWAPGRNSQLTMMREATGTNVPGKAWGPMHLAGRQVRVRIKHEEYPKGSGQLLDRVKSIAKV
jgi:hypothetical protein